MLRILSVTVIILLSYLGYLYAVDALPDWRATTASPPVPVSSVRMPEPVVGELADQARIAQSVRLDDGRPCDDCEKQPIYSDACPVAITPAIIDKGQSATLSWRGKGIRHINIVGMGRLRPTKSGSKLVKPQRTRSYKVNFLGFNGVRRGCSQKIIVRPPGLDVPKVPKVRIIEPMRTLHMYFNDNNSPRRHAMVAEMTPWSVGAKKASNGAMNSVYIIADKNTHVCMVRDNIFELTSETKMDLATCRMKASRALKAPARNVETAGLPLWKRDFYGGFSGQVTKADTGPLVNIFMHGELKNVKKRASVCVRSPDIGYGQFPCRNQKTFWKSYNAFVGLVTFPFSKAGLAGDESMAIDHGPVVWPSNGYVEDIDGKLLKATDIGVRHPHSFVHDGYMYLFYQDSSFGKEIAGRGPGIKVARAAITATGVDPLGFKVYYEGKWADNALPKGFDKAYIADFFAKKGGRSSAILWDEAVVANPHFRGLHRPERWRQRSDIINFSVTRFSGTDVFLGVANELSTGVTLRISRDLVNWSAAVVLPGTKMDFHKGGVDLMRDIPMFYPVAMNKDGDRTSEVDPDDFYIIGVQTKYHAPSKSKDRVVNAIRVGVAW